MDLSNTLSDQADVTLMMHAAFGDKALQSLLDLSLLEGTHPHRRSGIVMADRLEDLVPDDGHIVRSEGRFDSETAILAQGDGWVMRITRWSNRAQIDLVANTTATADRLVDQLRPHMEREPERPDHVLFGFWRHQSPNGCARFSVELEAPSWEEIVGNYATGTALAFAELIARGPGDHSKLMLLHGPPGTGKTTAIRALTREWRQSCDTSVIVDPERLFSDADYLHQILTSPAYLLTSEKPTLLVIEDADELISRQARNRTGQALSRLLNLADGLIGQAHKTLICITTNEPMDALHPAVKRPGRCLANIEFPALSRAEAAAWLGPDLDVPASGATLAELLVLRDELQAPLTGAKAQIATAGAYL